MKVGMGHREGEVGRGDEVQEYLAKDLADHSRLGKPYQILTDEDVGRHMVAVRDIKAGEVIMEDVPLTFGPVCSNGTAPVCLGCYKTLQREQQVLCASCGWPMCSAACSQRNPHQQLECSLFSKLSWRVDAAKFDYSGEPEPTYSCISPIRALMLREKDPQRWQMVWSLMSHKEARQKMSYWTEKHEPILKLVRETIGLVQFSEDEIDTVLGIFLVNDFEINAKVGDEEWSSQGRNSLRGLYQIASIPNHDCIANTSHTFASIQDGFRMVVRAGREIKEGEEITHSYVDPQEPVLVRQELLHLGKFFTCGCARCRDPTELGTFSSALRCPKCREPVVSTEPSQQTADWTCKKCKKTFDCLKISRVTAAVKDELEKLEPSLEQPELCDVPAHEAFLKKFSQILHPQHVHIIMAKYPLAKMLGRMKGWEADKLSEDQLRRKQQLCEEVLAVLDVIMPGESRMRGMMLYELHLPHVLLANRMLQAGPGKGADPAKIKTGLKTGLDCLTRGLNILKVP